jgi:hypothetical protein
MIGRGWSVVHYVDLGHGHDIVEKHGLREPCSIDNVMVDFFQTLSVIQEASYPGMHPHTPLFCQLLRASEASQIAKDTRPSSLEFLGNPSRGVFRMDRIVQICLPRDITRTVAPYFRDHTIFMYWRWVVPVFGVVPVVAPVMPLQVTLLTSGNDSYTEILSVSHGCTYKDFLVQLESTFTRGEAIPWSNFGDLIGGTPHQYWRGVFRLYLLPLAFKHDHLAILATIAVGDAIRINQVLHELMWHDWFKDTPISDILQGDTPYGLLVMPYHEGAWASYAARDRFYDLLSAQRVVVQPTTYIPMRVVPAYMAMELRREMEEIEDLTNMSQWLDQHQGLITLREPIDTIDCDIPLSEAERILVREQASVILEIARSCEDP